jgi:hypothetical protein
MVFNPQINPNSVFFTFSWRFAKYENYILGDVRASTIELLLLTPYRCQQMGGIKKELRKNEIEL